MDASRLKESSCLCVCVVCVEDCKEKSCEIKPSTFVIKSVELSIGFSVVVSHDSVRCFITWSKTNYHWSHSQNSTSMGLV